MLSNKTFSLPLKMSTILFMLFFVASVNLPAQTDYIVSEGHIVGDFEGWDGETLFEMSDGTFWIQAEYSYIYYYAYNPKAIVFKRGPNYYLKVERVRKILKVLPVDNVIKSRIDGDFKGFEGNTIYKLTNGTVWQQQMASINISMPIHRGLLFTGWDLVGKCLSKVSQFLLNDSSNCG